MIETRAIFKTGVSAVIYTNTHKLIKGNTVRDKFLVLADSVLFMEDANVSGGYLSISATNNNVDISFIKANSPSGKFLKDNGTWASADSLPSQTSNSGKFLTTDGSVASWIGLTANTILGTFLFSSGQGIDVINSSGSDVLNIGATNADVINYGNSSTVHNFLGTAIYEKQVNSYVTDKAITLNSGGTTSSGIGVGFEIEENSTITGYFKTNASRNGFSFKTPAIAYKADLNTDLLTTDRAFSFPNTAGTLLVGSVADQGIAFGSSGSLTNSSDITFNATTKILTLNGLINSSSSSGFQIGGSTKFAVSSSLLTNSLPMSFVAGTTSAAPIILSSGSLRTTPAIGNLEFLTDRLYFTKTTGTTRETLAYLSDIPSSGAGGSDSNIQYNQSGAFAGSTRFVWQVTNRYFKVDGFSLFGLATSNNPTAFVDIAGANTSNASLRIRAMDSGTGPASPNNGDIWQDGNDIWIFIGGMTRRFMLE
jgi:hypothetical protein